MALILRSKSYAGATTKGSKLTFDEVDSNFTYLNDLINNKENSLPNTVSAGNYGNAETVYTIGVNNKGIIVGLTANTINLSAFTNSFYPITGGTLNGNLFTNSTIGGNIVSGTTYYNLPTSGSNANIGGYGIYKGKTGNTLTFYGIDSNSNQIYLSFSGITDRIVIGFDENKLTKQVNTQFSLSGGGSISGNPTLSLVNDVSAPGINKFYRTDYNGNKGWKNAFAIPLYFNASATTDAPVIVIMPFDLKVTAVSTYNLNSPYLSYRKYTGSWGAWITLNGADTFALNDIVQFRPATTGGTSLYTSGQEGAITLTF